MIPGKMNSREVKRMMAQMGIKQTEMPDVKTVIFKGSTKDYMITEAQVTQVEAQGQKTFQITGNFKEVAKSAEEKSEILNFSEDDIKLVMDGASVTKEKAVEALKKADGEPAKAIMDLLPQ